MTLHQRLSLIAGSFILGLFWLPSNVAAATIPHLVTSGIANKPVSVQGETFFETDLIVEYESGDVLISKNADGSMLHQVFEIKDAIELIITRPDSSVEVFRWSFNPDCTIQTLSFTLEDEEPDEQEPEPGPNPVEISHLFAPGSNRVHVRLYHECSEHMGSAPIYLVNLGAPGGNGGVEPFLRLPWDYESLGLSFDDAALSINSYFDHTYPFLSTSLVDEPKDYKNQVTNFENKLVTYYSSHDGYDYGKDVGAKNGANVLAAASGCASYGSSTAGGNVIRIDHGNGYQSRYLHLQSEGLITTEIDPTKCVQVIQGQMIAKVGATGNVSPKGDKGAHIHFMVIQDKNGDGNFTDNIPDGLVDPFGWQSSEPDPWPQYRFMQAGVQRQGAVSHYLWQNRPGKQMKVATQNSPTQIEVSRYAFHFPEDISDEQLTIQVEAVPSAQISDAIQSLGHTVAVTARNSLNNLVTRFQTSFRLTVDFSALDLNPFHPATLAIYSTEDGQTWTKEETVIDWDAHTATAEIDHLSQFALMAERKDMIAPQTLADVQGSKGKLDWYRSAVMIALRAEDNPAGLGVDYTLYSLDGEDWTTYSRPIAVATPGTHLLKFYSVDRDENVEEERSLTFSIDTVPPEIKLRLDAQIWKPEFVGIDDQTQVTMSMESLTNLRQRIIVADQAGNTLTLLTQRLDVGSLITMGIQSLRYNQNPTITLPENAFASYFSLNRKTRVLESLSQTWWYKDPRVLRELWYTAHNNQTAVYTKQPGVALQKETRSGIVLWQIETRQGQLQTSYVSL